MVVMAVAWAGGYSSNWTPSLGASIWHGCALKSKKKKKKNHFIPIRMTTIQKKRKIMNVDKAMEIVELLCIVCGNVK